jgi:hypothetical protein
VVGADFPGHGAGERGGPQDGGPLPGGNGDGEVAGPVGGDDTPTPQAFSMASRISDPRLQELPRFTEDSRTRRARPVSARFEPVS